MFRVNNRTVQEDGGMRVANWTMTVMRILFALLFVLGWMTFSFSQAQEKKAPDKLTFESKMGNVTFDHAKHVERAKNDCATCHDKLFPQAKAPLNFKEKMHQVAEANKTSCGHCHVEGGVAFASKGKCNTCHVKK
jgi:c(7)-type cytochrome triheme protein